MKRLIVQNLRQRRASAITLVISIALAVAALAALFLLAGGMSRGIALDEERSGAQVLIVPSVAETHLEESDYLFAGAPVGAYLPKTLEDEVAAIDGVVRTSPQFYGQTMTESCCSTVAATRIVGFDPASDWVIAPFAPIDLSGGLADDEVLIGSNITGFTNNEGIIFNNPVRVVGQLAPTGTYLDNSLLLSIDRVRALMASKPAYDHYWEANGPAAGLITALLVETEEGQQDAVAGRINRLVDGDFSTIVRSEVIADAQQTLNTTFLVMLIAGIALAIVALLQLFARFFTLVWDRRPELALYRALGARTRDVRAIIGGEAFALCAIGVGIGIAGGIGLYLGMLALLQSAERFPFEALSAGVAFGGIALLAMIFFAMCALSIAAPLSQARRIDPAEALAAVDIG